MQTRQGGEWMGWRRRPNVVFLRDLTAPASSFGTSRRFSPLGFVGSMIRSPVLSVGTIEIDKVVASLFRVWGDTCRYSNQTDQMTSAQ